MPTGEWTWLEVAKLVVGFSGPVVVLILGLWVRKVVDRIEHRRWAEQSTITWRLSVFERLAPKLNALYSTFSYIGRWREFLPSDIIALKRDLDEIVFTYDFLWSDEFKQRYSRLMAACFDVNQGPGKDAKIKANIDMFRSAHANWDTRWDELFVEPDDRTRRGVIELLVNDVLNAAIRDLTLNLRVSQESSTEDQIQDSQRTSGTPSREH
jgi:hypothetical protein